MRVTKKILSRLGIVGEILVSFWQCRFWWLIPMVLVLLIVGVLLAFAQATAIAPFIYTLF
jgi:uncharacterized membrane protein